MFTPSDIAQHYQILTASICELPKDPERRYSEFGVIQRAVYQQTWWQFELPLESEDES